MSVARRRWYPIVVPTGRCFLLRPSRHASRTTPVHLGDTALHDEVECVELTHSSSLGIGQHSLPASLTGNRYYTRRYTDRARCGTRCQSAEASHVHHFQSGDLVLNLHRSAVPRKLTRKRVVDVTGVHTSFLRSSERDGQALATVEEAIETMHLHDGHEVPALQRGDVDLMRLQPMCVYVRKPLLSSPSREWRSSTAHSDATDVVGLTKLRSALLPLDNAVLLLAQAQHLTFRSEMEALQSAQLMAASLKDLSGNWRRIAEASGAGSSRKLALKPVVRDGHVVAMSLRMLA